MEKIANSLIKLNNHLYNYWVHIPVLCLWILTMCLYPKSFLSFWFFSGILVYIVLLLFRAIQSWTSNQNELENLKKIGKENPLGLLVGLNLSVVLGISSFIVILILTLGSKKDSKQ